jgi:predicted phosphodiesterase
MSRGLRHIGLVGDIHAEDVLLERALDFLRDRGVELVVATGDVVDGAGSVERCFDLLRERKVVVVRGNHDRWLLGGTARELPEATAPDAISPQTRHTLRRLPALVELETVQGRALLCHGLGSNDMAKVGTDDDGYALESNDDLQRLVGADLFRWVLNGHSHRAMVRTFGGLTLVNAGTLKREHDPCFFELDFERLVALRYAFDAAGTIEAGVAIPLGGGSGEGTSHPR